MRLSVYLLGTGLLIFLACGSPDAAKLKSQADSNSEARIRNFLASVDRPGEQETTEGYIQKIIDKSMEMADIEGEGETVGMCVASLTPEKYHQLSSTSNLNLSMLYGVEGVLMGRPLIRGFDDFNPYMWYSAGDEYKPEECRDFFEIELPSFMGRNSAFDRNLKELSPKDFIVTFVAMKKVKGN